MDRERMIWELTEMIDEMKEYILDCECANLYVKMLGRLETLSKLRNVLVSEKNGCENSCSSSCEHILRN